ncbi:hypothetical protein V6N11_052746 [Hibiscus sabdariffa]|uniref:Uncharacterized protein n=1 Tax=Hibiscus sabdariffa TaxID=183260 RepID=A0ABR2UAX6_9ROSI
MGGPDPIGREKVPKKFPKLLRTIPPIPSFVSLLNIAPSIFIFKNPNGGASQERSILGLLGNQPDLSAIEGSIIKSSREQVESGVQALNQLAARVLTRKNNCTTSSRQLLKTISFLNNQIVHSIAKGRICQMESRASERQIPCQARRNASGSPGKASDSPQYAAHLDHTCQATVQLKRRWNTDYGFNPHNGQRMLFMEDTPLVARSTRTEILFRITSQVKISTIGGAIPRHTNEFHSPPKNTLLESLLTKDLTENLPSLEPSHLIQSIL